MGEHAHFDSKDPVEHVAEMQAKGIIDATEIHGTELPGHWSAATDAAKETAIVNLLIWILIFSHTIDQETIFKTLLTFSAAWMAWKGGRSAWLGWSRLERLHRVVAQEKWEIDHHRDQEREELTALYRAKGFEGKLLEDVIDTLMADNNRLLTVMVEEELGLSLESQEHPLKQSLGAILGVLVAVILSIVGLYVSIDHGILMTSLLTVGISSLISASYEKNERIPALLWNIGLALFSFGTLYYLQEFLKAL